MFVLLEMIIRHHSTWGSIDSSTSSNHGDNSKRGTGGIKSGGGVGSSSGDAEASSSSGGGGGEVGSSSSSACGGVGSSSSSSAGGGVGSSSSGAGGGVGSSSSGAGGEVGSSSSSAGGGVGSSSSSSAGGGVGSSSSGAGGGVGSSSSGAGGGVGSSSSSAGGGVGGSSSSSAGGGVGSSSSGAGGGVGSSSRGSAGGGVGSSSSGAGGGVGSSSSGAGGGVSSSSSGAGGEVGSSSSGGGGSVRGSCISSSGITQLDASKRGANNRSLVLAGHTTASLIAPLHLLVLLTHPSRCSPAVHASSMAAALPLLGALVSCAKAVRHSRVMSLAAASGMESFCMLLLLSKNVFQLLEGKLTILQGNACQQQGRSGGREALGAIREETHRHGQVQQQQQPQQHDYLCQQEVTLEICRAFLWTGVQLLGSATVVVHSVAIMLGTVSLECIRNQQLAEALVAAAPPTFQDSLQQMMQQAKCSAEGAGMGQQEEEASTAVAGGGAAAAGAAKQGAERTAAAAGRGELQALTVAAAGAGRTAAERGGNSADEAGESALGQAVLEPTAATVPAAATVAAPAAATVAAAIAPAAAPAQAPAAAELNEASAVSQLYSGLRGLCKRPGGLAALRGAVCVAYNKTMPEVLPLELLFSMQHADLCRQVVADTEEGMEPPGRLIQCLFQTAASLRDLFELLPDQLLLAGRAASGKPLQMVRAAPLVQLPISGELAQGPLFAVLAARNIQVTNLLVGTVVESYLRGASGSFCCGNAACRVMRGSSEVGLVMAGAGGRGGGGYCPGCRRVCYCSEACQGAGWEHHKGVCSRYQEEKAAVGGTASTSSIGSSAGRVQHSQ